MFNDNSRNNSSTARTMDQVDAVSSAPLRWNQHPVISTVLWMLGSDNGQGPVLQPSSSIDNFRPASNPSGLDDYLNKHFEQVERRRSSSASAPGGSHKTLGTVSEEGRYRSTTLSNSATATQYIAPEEFSERVTSVAEAAKAKESEEQSDDEEKGGRTSSSDGTQLCPSSISSQYGHGNGYHYPKHGTPGQGNYYPAQQYQNTIGAQSNRDYNDEPPVDATPSPQWGFYVAITPPQQDMYNAIKKDLVTIQQQQLQSSAQKNLAS
jgi:hypothetical protein